MQRGFDGTAYMWRAVVTIALAMAFVGVFAISTVAAPMPKKGPESLEASAPPVAAAQQAAPAVVACGPGCQLWSGSRRLVRERGAFPGISGHAETSTILWRGRPLLYYRTFVNAGSGARCPFPQGIAVALSGDSGRTWAPRDGGRPLPALRSVYGDRHVCPPTAGGTVASTWVYAPDVIVDEDRLVMAFEQRDWNPRLGRALHSIRYVTSTDGINWSTSRLLLNWGAVGAWDDEVGTPDIEKDGTAYLLTFHGHDSRNSRPQVRAFVRFSTLGGEVTSPRTRIALSPVPAWADYGVGMSDMRRESDGYWYVIFEAFSGKTGACRMPTGHTDTAVGIARTMDMRTWSIRGPLLTDLDERSCGWDMPSFQILNDVVGIVTPDDPPEGRNLLRWRIAPIPASAPASGDRMASNTYLSAGSSLLSSTGAAQLVMQSDGNLVLYRTSGGVLWASGTNGTGAVRAVMQHGGSLVLVRADGVAVWSTRTPGRPGAVAIVQPDRLIIAFDRTQVWRTPPDRLLSGESLRIGRFLRAANGATELHMQRDGNLVLYRTRDGFALWASKTSGSGATIAVMQSGGNLVLVNEPADSDVWSTGTHRYPGSYAVVQTDGNFVIYDTTGQWRWQSGSRV